MPDLRGAAAHLTPRERAVLLTHLRRASQKVAAFHPALADFWAAAGDLVAEVDHLERTRQAAGPAPQYIRTTPRVP